MTTKKTDHEDAKSMKLKLKWVSKNGKKEKLMREECREREKNRWTEVDTKIEAKKEERSFDRKRAKSKRSQNERKQNRGEEHRKSRKAVAYRRFVRGMKVIKSSR